MSGRLCKGCHAVELDHCFAFSPCCFAQYQHNVCIVPTQYRPVVARLHHQRSLWHSLVSLCHNRALALLRRLLSVNSHNLAASYSCYNPCSGTAVLPGISKPQRRIVAPQSMAICMPTSITTPINRALLAAIPSGRMPYSKQNTGK